ncbi:hypothetical protein O181_112130 [Austropuccinia psidii MF-1]|uniref:Uncharacterized protein n=1 Tax=Austropuccinia psidii MF-1 TaxID=1389203 RepID=A0A9Q3JZU8_9BASI|nr:hypothetical protein [Austropuccinia psidii MF-1]
MKLSWLAAVVPFNSCLWTPLIFTGYLRVITFASSSFFMFQTQILEFYHCRSTISCGGAPLAVMHRHQ